MSKPTKENLELSKKSFQKQLKESQEQLMNSKNDFERYMALLPIWQLLEREIEAWKIFLEIESENESEGLENLIANAGHHIQELQVMQDKLEPDFKNFAAGARPHFEIKRRSGEFDQPYIFVDYE